MNAPPKRSRARMMLGWSFCPHRWSAWWLAPPFPWTPRYLGERATHLRRCELCGNEAIATKNYIVQLPIRRGRRR